MIKNERETTKTRTAFDASSKIGNNPSLIDFLQSGSCLLPTSDLRHLVEIWNWGHGLGSRQQVFLNIEIDEGNRDFLKFL